MTNLKEKKVVSLIKTLSKAEKKYFRLFVQRNQGNGNQFFIQLFDIYDQFGMISDEVITEKIEGVKKRQLSNIRLHLYQQLLTSIRLQNQKSNDDIEIRQNIDFAKVLYNKGLYMQSLEILAKFKQIAIDQNRNILALEIIFYEKAIESQNITKSIKTRAEDLITESESIVENITSISKYSNSSLQLYAYFLKHNFCKSKKELKDIEEKFGQFIEQPNTNKTDFYSSFYQLQTKTWYYYIRQDFEKYFTFSKQWVQLFQLQREMLEQRPSLYLKGIHNVIGAAFISLDNSTFITYYNLLKDFKLEAGNSLTYNDEGMVNLYLLMHEFDYHFFTGEFSALLRRKEDIEKQLTANPFHWDDHRISVFYYKLGCLAFGVNDFKLAIDYFLKVADFYKSNSNSMVFLFSKILMACSHFHLNNYQLVDSLVQSLQKEVNKDNQYRPLEKAIISLLRKLIFAVKSEQKTIFQESLSELKEIRKDPFARISFLHFFAIEWIEAILENTEAQLILTEKFKELNK